MLPAVPRTAASILAPAIAVLLLAPGLALASPEGSGPSAEIIIAVKPGAHARERIAVPASRALGAKGDLVLDKTAQEVRDVLWDDLRYSGVFDLVPKELVEKVPPTTPEKVPYEEWVAVGAAWVAALDVSTKDGELVLEGRLFETKLDRKLVLGKRYQAKFEVARKVAHTFADEVIGQVGGELGVCTTQIAFVSDRDGPRAPAREVYVSDYDGFNARRLTTNHSLSMAPDWSPSNDEIVYTSYLRGNPDLYVMPKAGGTNRVLFAKNNGLNTSPAWSPDGKTIAFSSSFEGRDSEIYAIRPDGSELRRLTKDPGIDTNPAWSPTGRELAFTSDRSGHPQIWVMDGDGLNVRRVTTQGAFNDGAAWAPKGKNTRIAYAGMSGGAFEIFVLTVETGEIQQLTDSGKNEAPSWSPDGRQIAFASTRGGRTDIWVMNDDGSNQRRITSGGNNVSPAWSHR